MAGVMGNPIGDKSYYLQKDLNNLTANGIYVCYYTQGDRVNEAHYPDTASTYFQIVVYRTVSWIKQTATNVNSLETFVRVKDGDKDWSTWQRIDNFGYNSVAELAGGVASEMGVKSGFITQDTPTKMKLGSGFLFMNIGGSHSSLFHLSYWTPDITLIGGPSLGELGTIVQDANDKYMFTITVNGTNARYFFIGMKFT